jgi:hypothetical protein
MRSPSEIKSSDELELQEAFVLVPYSIIDDSLP